MQTLENLKVGVVSGAPRSIYPARHRSKRNPTPLPLPNRAKLNQGFPFQNHKLPTKLTIKFQAWHSHTRIRDSNPKIDSIPWIPSEHPHQFYSFWFQLKLLLRCCHFSGIILSLHIPHKRDFKLGKAGLQVGASEPRHAGPWDEDNLDVYLLDTDPGL